MVESLVGLIALSLVIVVTGLLIVYGGHLGRRD